MARKTLYESLVGAVEILGDPALKVEAGAEGGAVIKYKDKEFTSADQINLGVGGRFSIAANTTVQVTPPNISDPFVTQKLTVPSSVSLFLMFTAMQVGSTVLLDGDPICADIFSEVSLNAGVRWPTAQTGQAFKLSVMNTDLVNAHEPRISLTGVRLR